LSWQRRLLVGCLRGLLRALSRWEIRGRGNLPSGGPLIVVFNHVAHLDGPLIIASLPWEVEGISLSDLYAVPVVGQLLRMYGVIAVRRDEFDRQVVRKALQVLSEGKVLALAPEARESPSGAMERGREGAAYLAMRSGAPVLPIGLTGTETALCMLKRLRRPHLTVNICAPLQLPGPLAHGAARQAQLQAGHAKIMRRIARLLPARYRGVYAQ